MKIITLAILILLLVGAVASAQRDYAQAGPFNVSFDINKTHEIIVDPSKNLNQTLHIKTFDGKADVTILNYAISSSTIDLGGYTIPEIYIDNMRTYDERSIVVDDRPAYLLISISDTSQIYYFAEYYPSSTCEVRLVSTLPLLDTAHLLETIHIEKSKG